MSLLSIIYLYGSDSGQQSKDMLFCLLSVLEKQIDPTPQLNFIACLNQFAFYFLVTNWLLSKTSILTFLSFSPDETNSITYVLPPGIFRQTGQLDERLNSILQACITMKRVNKVVLRTRFAIQSVFLSLYFIIMNYWDIESFLAEDQPALFKFTEDAEQMTFLDPSKGIAGAVPAQAPLHAPIWVVSTLRDYVFKKQAELVQVAVPKYLERDHNQGYLKALQNDRSATFQTINLRQKSPYYYQNYDNLQKPLQGNKNLIEAKLIKAMLLIRGSAIIEKASTHQQQGKAQSKFDYYTEVERNLFRNIRQKTLEYEKWESKRQLNAN